MGERFVPVSLGSPRFKTVDVGALKITDAWFPSNLRLPPHHHDRACFAVVIDGSFDVRFGGRTHDCPAATVWTEPAGERHGNRAQRAGARVLVVQPDMEQDELLHPLRGVVDSIHHFQHAAIATLARRAAQECRRPDAVTALSLESLALEMLVTARRHGQRTRRDSRPPAWLRRTQDYLHDHFKQKVSVAELAREAGVHPVHLSRVFRRHLKTSIGEYVRGLRLDWAARRVAGSATALCDISLEAGFSDQSHFTRHFRDHTGLTPGRYREAMRTASRSSD